jgi:hypothetical protein
MSTLRQLQTFLTKLEETGTHFSLLSGREGGVMVIVTLPGERWEVEFFHDRDPEIEIFRSDGKMFGSEKFADLWDLAKD